MAQFSYIISENYFLLFMLSLPLLFLIFKTFKTLVASKTVPTYPPGPTPWPILGNIPHVLGKMRHVALSDISKNYGPLFMIQIGTQKMVVASSPAAAKEILRTHDRVLSTRYIPKSVPLNRDELNFSSIAMSETCSDTWKYLRTLCRAGLFSTKSLDAQTYLREKKMLEMIEYIKSAGVVNLKEVVFVTLWNTMSNILFSRDLVGFDEDDGGMRGVFRKIIVSFAALNVSDIYPILNKFDLQGIRKSSLQERKKIEDFIEIIVHGRIKVGASLNPNDFLDVLLLNKFTTPRIQQLFLEFLLAGADGITTTVEWAMTELIKNPESMKKVVQELDTQVGSDQVKEHHIAKLTYLQACIKETFRTHPPGPFLLPRRAPETCQVMNYTIPKNAQIYINIWAIGRDPTIWDEPLKFRPERFLNVDVDYIGNDFELLTFGSGRRICVGLPMAKRQIPLILATLLHSFDWSLPEGKDSNELDMNEEFDISLHREQPLLLIPQPRY